VHGRVRPSARRPSTRRSSARSPVRRSARRGRPRWRGRSRSGRSGSRGWRANETASAWARTARARRSAWHAQGASNRPVHRDPTRAGCEPLWSKRTPAAMIGPAKQARPTSSPGRDQAKRHEAAVRGYGRPKSLTVCRPIPIPTDESHNPGRNSRGCLACRSGLSLHPETAFLAEHASRLEAPPGRPRSAPGVVEDLRLVSFGAVLDLTNLDADRSRQDGEESQRRRNIKTIATMRPATVVGCTQSPYPARRSR
jgi:hypothetical protein